MLEVDKIWVEIEAGNPNIVGTLEIHKYALLVNKCHIAEHNLMDMAAEGNKHLRKRGILRKKKLNKPNFKGGQNQDRRPQVIRKGHVCFTYKKNHGTKPFGYGLQVCYTCGKAGHFAKECP